MSTAPAPAQQPAQAGYWERTGNLLVWHPARPQQAGARP